MEKQEEKFEQIPQYIEISLMQFKWFSLVNN